MEQWWNRALLDEILQNRSRLRLGEVNATCSLIQNSSTHEKPQFTIDEHTLNSLDSWGYSQGIDETVGIERSRNTKQKEFWILVENWKSLIQFCLMNVLEFWRKMEGKTVGFLVIFCYDQKLVMIKCLYFQLITS